MTSLTATSDAAQGAQAWGHPPEQGQQSGSSRRRPPGAGEGAWQGGLSGGGQGGQQPITDAQPLGRGQGPPLRQHDRGQLQIQLRQGHGYPIG